LSYLGSVITSDAICIHEVKSSNAMAKAAFNKMKTISPADWTPI